LLVNDTQKIRNGSISHQYFPLRMQINSPVMVGTVSVLSNSEVSLRGEDGFQSNSDALDTHYSIFIGGFN
jgi:hypothetical protein